MATLTIFANFCINDEERFLRMKDSFFSIKDIDAFKWVINVRGRYKFDTLFFLHDNLGEKLVPFMLESKNGWFYDTKSMLDNIDTDYVFFWIEDHINLIDVHKYQDILNEMKESGSEYLCYTWWNSGKIIDPYKVLAKKEHRNISTFLLNKASLDKIGASTVYIISMAGFFDTSLFKKIIMNPRILRGYSKFCPFDFEKGGGDTEWLPIRYALPRYELLASIDDGGEDYCLQGRGLYPKREVRQVSIPTSTPYWKLLFREKIRKYLPNFIYNNLIKVVIFFNKVINYINLLRKGV